MTCTLIYLTITTLSVYRYEVSMQDQTSCCLVLTYVWAHSPSVSEAWQSLIVLQYYYLAFS